MSAITLSFSPAGIGSCFYTEAIALHTIGTLDITRATTIEFNASQQLWEVSDNHGQILYANASRQQCLDWEQRHFNP
jgi:hypothetical protein